MLVDMIRAMKAIRKNQVMKEKEAELFNEVAILKLLDHPNIIKLFELFQDDTHYYLITEYKSPPDILLPSCFLDIAQVVNYLIGYRRCTHSAKRWQLLI